MRRHEPESLERLGLLDGQEQQSIQELAATSAVQVWLVSMLGFSPGAHSVHGQFLEVFGIVIIARGEGIEATSEAVNGTFESQVIFIGEEDVETAVQMRRGELMEVLRDECDADEIGLGALQEGSAGSMMYAS